MKLLEVENASIFHPLEDNRPDFAPDYKDNQKIIDARKYTSLDRDILKCDVISIEHKYLYEHSLYKIMVDGNIGYWWYCGLSRVDGKPMFNRKRLTTEESKLLHRSIIIDEVLESSQ